MVSPVYSSLPYTVEHHAGSRKSNPMVSPVYSSLPYAVEHHAGSRKSNPMISPVYSPLPMLLSIMRVHGNLTPWYHQYTALSPYAVEHHVGSRKSNPMASPIYSSLLMLLSIMWVHGNLTPWYHQYTPLSLYTVEHHVGSRKSNPMVSPVYFSLSVSSLMTIVWLHLMLMLWDTMTKGTASGYPLITLLQIDIHSPRFWLLSYRDFCVLSFRTVGMKLDSNCYPYLLSPTASAPRTRYLGSQVTRFAGPFESRPTDTIRREVYRQLAGNSSSASSSGWVAPTATLTVTPPPLEKGTEESASAQLPSKPKGKRRRPL